MHTGVDNPLTLHSFARIHLMDTNITFSYINGETNFTVWPGWLLLLKYLWIEDIIIIVTEFIIDKRGFPPIIIMINVMKTSVYTYLAILVITGVMLSIVCLIFTIVYKNRKLVVNLLHVTSYQPSWQWNKSHSVR